MKRPEVRDRLEAMAVHCDLIAHSYREMARLAKELKLITVVAKVDDNAPRIFQRIAEECRKQAEAI